MTDATPAKKSKVSWLKLLSFGFLTSVLMGVLFIWLFYGKYIVGFWWMNEIQKGVNIAANDLDSGKAHIEKTLNNADHAGLPAYIRMSMYRKYATFLYGLSEVEQGDRQIDKAITIAKEQPADLEVADQLSHAYQDRGWEHHYLYLNKLSSDPGDKDQEQSVAVAEKHFGPDHDQTSYKLSALAVINADLNRNAKADEEISRAIKSVNKPSAARSCATFAYMMLARTRAVQGRYDNAMEAFLKARSLAADPASKERVTKELVLGLYRGPEPSNPLRKQAKTLLNRGKYDELDKLGDAFCKSQTAESDGSWKLDQFCNALEAGHQASKSYYDQVVFDLREWIAHNPRSVTARAALAQTYIYNSRRKNTGDGSQWPGSSYSLSEAKKVLDADPTIRKKTPLASSAYLRIVANQYDSSQRFMDVVDECHRIWPIYLAVDNWAFHYLGRGEDDDFLVKRADAIGGARGDEFYSQFVWWAYLGDGDIVYEHAFPPDSPIKWDRTKKGFRQIFNDFPGDMKSRVAFIRLALAVDDKESIKTAFKDFRRQ